MDSARTPSTSPNAHPEAPRRGTRMQANGGQGFSQLDSLDRKLWLSVSWKLLQSLQAKKERQEIDAFASSLRLILCQRRTQSGVSNGFTPQRVATQTL